MAFGHSFCYFKLISFHSLLWYYPKTLRFWFNAAPLTHGWVFNAKWIECKCLERIVIFIPSKTPFNVKMSRKIFKIMIYSFWNYLRNNLGIAANNIAAIANGEYNDDDIRRVDLKFITYLRELVPLLRAPENLIVEKISGNDLLADSLEPNVFNGMTCLIQRPFQWFIYEYENSSSWFIDICV